MFVWEIGDLVDVVVLVELLLFGFFYLLEWLSPREWVVFVLIEVFVESHEWVGVVVGVMVIVFW